MLVHRRDGFRAQAASVSKMKELCENWEMQFEVGQVTNFSEKDGRLTEVHVTGADGVTRRIPLDHLLVFFGLQPKLGPIENWGLKLERRQIVVDTARFESSVPGIFAVGDINTYPGKKKLILSGFHECALAAFAACDYVFPEKRVFLQYTTTSPKLHKVLGVEMQKFDDYPLAPKTPARVGRQAPVRRTVRLFRRERAHSRLPEAAQRRAAALRSNHSASCANSADHFLSRGRTGGIFAE